METGKNNTHADASKLDSAFEVKIEGKKTNLDIISLRTPPPPPPAHEIIAPPRMAIRYMIMITKGGGRGRSKSTIAFFDSKKPNIILY